MTGTLALQLERSQMMSKSGSAIADHRGFYDDSRAEHASMRIFLHGRDRGAIVDPGSLLRDDFKSAVDAPSVDAIEAEHSGELANSTFKSLYNLEKRLINRLISVEIQKNTDSAIISLYKKMFFCIKQCMRIRFDNFSQPYFMDRYLKREFFLRKLSEDFREAFDEACLPGERLAFAREVLSAAGLDIGSGSIAEALSAPQASSPTPTEAPALWRNRPSRKSINPANFVLETYHPWIGKGLTRAALHALDSQLYYALAKWLMRHPDDELSKTINGLLPDRKRRTETELNALGLRPRANDKLEI